MVIFRALFAPHGIQTPSVIDRSAIIARGAVFLIGGHWLNIHADEASGGGSVVATPTFSGMSLHLFLHCGQSDEKILIVRSEQSRS